MKKNKQIARIKYEPEADVLSWEVSGASIDSASEIGNVIVHFSKKNIPVFIEILDASHWLKQSEKAFRTKRSVAVPA
jgi:uncharacterized protein YuzE